MCIRDRLSDTLRQAERHPSFSLSYNYLWILELAVFYAEHGFPPLPGIDLDTLFREAEISPSPMMRGHALRDVYKRQPYMPCCSCP